MAIKLANKVQSKQPGSDRDKGESLTNSSRRFLASAITQAKTRTDVNEIIRLLMREEGLFSSATQSMVAIASKSGYRIAGYSAEGVMDLGVMDTAYSVLDSIDSLDDYEGFNDNIGVDSLLSTLTLDVVASGGCGAELVLSKEHLPNRIVPISYNSITWNSDGNGGRYPTQENGDIELNVPNVFVAEHNRMADESYAESMMRSGLMQTFEFAEFLEDTHRSLNRSGHNRLIATLDQSKVRDTAPADIRNDPKKMAEYYNSVRSAVEDAISGAEPEDAFVAYDSVEYDVKEMAASKADYSSLLTTLGNLLGVSLKTPASVSGLRSSGAQALSNAETLIYLKVVEAVRPAVEIIMSRALTLAIRLLGVDGYIKFEFNPIDLRPKTELEAYQGARLNRVLTLLSYGIINDAMACYELGIRPSGLIKELAGTGFYQTKVQEGTGERESSTGRALNPGTPSKSGGRDN